MSSRFATSRARSALEPRKPLPVRRFHTATRDPPTGRVPIKNLTLEQLRARFEISDTRMDRLRFLKSDALDHLDLDRADAIQRIMELSVSDTSESLISEYTAWLQPAIDDALAQMDEQLRAESREMAEVEFEYRCGLDQVFSAMQARHVDGLAVIEFNRAVELLREETRETGEIWRLKKQARSLAATDDMDQARRAKMAAEKRRNESELTRKEMVNRRFDRQRERYLKKSIEAVAALQEELKTKLEEKERVLQAKRQAVQQKATVFIQNELQRAVLRVSSDQRLTASVKKKTTEKVTAWVEQYLRSTGNQHLLE